MDREEEITIEKFYHILVRRLDNRPGKPSWIYEINLCRSDIIEKFVIPYLSKENVICSGYIFQYSEITAMKIFETDTRLEFDKNDKWEIDKLVHENGKDVSSEIIVEAKKLNAEHTQKSSDPTSEALRWIEKFSTRYRAMSKLLETRRKGKSPFKILDEYDFQNLLHCFLTVEFNDVRTEVYVSEHAGGSTKMDFLLPEFSITIETKFVTETHGRKEIGEELIIDTAKYSEHPKCDVLVCLVYDPNYLIENKSGFKADLEKNPRPKVRVFVIQ